MDSPIRVLRVITRLNIGGPVRHAAVLSAGLAERNFKTVLLAGSLGEEEGDMSYLTQNTGDTANTGFKVETIPALTREILPGKDIKALSKITRACIRFRPHIIHTHTSKAGFLGRLAGLLAGVPVRIHTFHGHIFDGYFSPQKTKRYIFIERFLGALSHRIIALSRDQKKDLSEVYRIAPSRKIHVIPLGFQHLDGLATAKEHHKGELRNRLGLDKETPLVGTVGRLVEIKGLDLLIETAALLRREVPSVHFVVAGNGHLKGRLQERARELDMENRIHFLGWEKDLAAIYADIDVFALTSLNEGTPVAVIEALAAKVPVVATGVGGVPDVLEHGRLGSLVYSRDPIEMKEQIKNALFLEFSADGRSAPTSSPFGQPAYYSTNAPFGKPAFSATNAPLAEPASPAKYSSLKAPSSLNRDEISSTIRARYSSKRLLDDMERLYRDALQRHY